MSILGQGMSGIREVTPESLVLDVGIMYANIDEAALRGGSLVDALEDAIHLGATRKGAKFNDGKKLRDVELDGRRFPIKSLKRPEEFMPTLEVELIEVTQLNFAANLGSSIKDNHATHTEYQLSVDTNDDDYIANVCVIATHTSGDDPFIIVMRDCLQSDATPFTLEDKNEMGLAFKMTAHALASAPYDSPVSFYVPNAAPAS